MRKLKRMTIAFLAMAMLVSTLAMSASAASTTVSLTESEYMATSYSKKGSNVQCYLYTHTSSNDGVNMDAYTEGGIQVRHIFSNPGESMTSAIYYGSNTNYYAILTSWWLYGSGCRADGTLYVN